MDKVPESELLSAYLDGELTAAERASGTTVGRRSGGAAVGGGVPRWARRCNRCRGRRLARTSAPASSNWPSAACWPQTPQEPPQKQPAEPPQPAWRNTVRGMLSRQALVWSGLAVAIAVMMMIWNRPPETHALLPLRLRPRRRNRRPSNRRSETVP